MIEPKQGLSSEDIRSMMKSNVDRIDVLRGQVVCSQCLAGYPFGTKHECKMPEPTK